MKSQQQTNNILNPNQVQDLYQLDKNVLYKMNKKMLNLSLSLSESKNPNTIKSDIPKSNFEISELHIKHMVSRRCEMAVKLVLENLGLFDTIIELGLVKIKGRISEEMRERIKSDLSYYELELLENKKVKLVEKIKKTVVELLQFEKEHRKVKIPSFLHKKFNSEYTNTYLSNTFSEVTGVTIEHYVLIQKIELAKELIVYHNKMTLTDIAWQLNYSSVGHLCNQFKDITGLTPSFFKNIRSSRLAMQ